MENWKNKLLAFLHDPPHKPFRIAGHEDARGPLLRHVGLSEADIGDWHARPDWWAAAADRFPFPKASVLHVDWKEDSALEFRHPLAGTRMIPPNQPRPASSVGEKWVEDVMHGLPVAEADWRKKFFLVWRFWEERAAREKNPLLAYLVADTRIPDHTLWHHNGLVSAMEGAGKKPAFLIFQIGPVQDFIAQARKTQDLWSGSYLLSFLISKALALLAVRLGPDAVVYPNLRGSPLLDWWWSREEGLFPPGALRLGEGRLHPNELLTPCLPNRFLALIPADAGRQLASDLEIAVRKLWEEIADSVHADICAKLQDQLRENELAGWDAQWQQQVARFPVIDWAIHEWPGQDKAIENAKQDTPPIGEGWKQSALAHAAAWRDMIPPEHRENWHGNPNDAFAWPLHYAMADWKLAARKATRAFPQWATLAPGAGSPPKDHLNGRDEVLGGPDHAAFWQALRSAYGGNQSGDFKGRQLYGAISVIKRLWPRTYLSGKCGWQVWRPDFDSVQGVSGQRHEIRRVNRAISSEPDEAAPKGDPAYYAILAMDGDDMGQWVSGARTPELELVMAEKAWAYFQNGKGGQGGWKPAPAEIHNGLQPDPRKIRRPLSPGFHAALSEALGNFGLYCAGQIVEGFGGQLLFSGGDDVLAMLPAHAAMDCALALQCAFRGELPADLPQCVKEKLNGLFESPAPGFLRCLNSGSREALRPNWPLIVPGPRASASAGIAIGHVHSPMQDTIQAARDAERIAKSVAGKGAFCLSILKRSGEQATFAARFQSGVGNVWADLEANPHKLSGRFPYRLLQNARMLLCRSGAVGDAGWEPQWTGELVASVEAELRTVCYQQNESREPAARKREIARDLAGHWMRQLVGSAAQADAPGFSPALSPKGFIHFWMAWAFVRRMGESAIG